jgi:hypothetical protein
VEGVALPLIGKVGARSPTRNFFTTTFPVSKKQQYYLVDYWDGIGIDREDVDELWHPLFFLLLKK